MKLREYTDKQIRDAYQYQFDLEKDPRDEMAILRTTTKAKKKMLQDEMDRRGIHWRILNSQKQTINITNSEN